MSASWHNAGEYMMGSTGRFARKTLRKWTAIMPVPFVDGHVLDIVGARDRGVDEEIGGTAEAHRQRPRTSTKPSSAITSR
jgi:hypothetical protein